VTLPAEVDVLVIGFGAAGAAAAIAAHDAGASVLYSAGAAGSVWGHLTEHGGGLTDAIVFGRIAGAGAAARA
jgi:succinate dehydrogenase/fumarate reductase flavoprotein subunit